MTDKSNLVEKLMDRILLNCPDFEPFIVSDIIKNTKFESTDEKLLANKHKNEINILFTDHLKYAIETSPNSILFRLSPLGTKVKKAGGHFAYLKPEQDKELAEIVRQSKTDKILDIDIKQKPFTFKTRWLQYGFSFLVLCGTAISIIISLKALNYKKDPQELQKMKESIEQLKRDLKRQDSLLKVDTSFKKHN
jgi:hypothetical protein